MGAARRLRAQLAPVFETRFQPYRLAAQGPGRRADRGGAGCGRGACRRAQPADLRDRARTEGRPAGCAVRPGAGRGPGGSIACRSISARPSAACAWRMARARNRSSPCRWRWIARMSVEDGFAAIVQACLAQFQANLPGVLASDDIEYVHQARVALRRLRAALRLYRRVCVPPDELMDGLRALAAALGAARDWDVLCDETLPAIAPHYPDADAWQHGMQALQAHRAEVRAAMRAALIQARPGAWLLALQRWLLLRGWRAVPEAQRFIQLSPLEKWARPGAAEGASPHRSRRARFWAVAGGAAPCPAHCRQAPTLRGRVFPDAVRRASAGSVSGCAARRAGQSGAQQRCAGGVGPADHGAYDSTRSSET